jgi:hypothetical protein
MNKIKMIFYFKSQVDQEECLVKPEFEGLWNKTIKKYDADDFYKTNVKFPPCFKTKAEKVAPSSC